MENVLCDYKEVTYAQLEEVEQYINNAIRFEVSNSVIPRSEKDKIKDNVEDYYFYIVIGDVLLFSIVTPCTIVNKRVTARLLNFSRFLYDLFPSTFNAARYGLRSYASICLMEEDRDVPFQKILYKGVYPVGYFSVKVGIAGTRKTFYVVNPEEFKSSYWRSSCHRKGGLTKCTFNYIVERLALSNMSRGDYIQYIKDTRKPYNIESYSEFVRLYRNFIGDLGSYEPKYASSNVCGLVVD